MRGQLTGLNQAIADSTSAATEGLSNTLVDVNSRSTTKWPRKLLATSASSPDLESPLTGAPDGLFVQRPYGPFDTV